MSEFFLDDETGAVTVEFVVIAALVLGVSMTVMLSIGAGTDTASCTLAKGIVDNPVALEVGNSVATPTC